MRLMRMRIGPSELCSRINTTRNSTGWHLGNVHHGSTNDYGYVSPFDYEGVTNGIAVFGDSYVESLMNEYEHSISGALARYLSSPTPVMNFGISGASMPHYLGAHRSSPVASSLIGR